MSSETVETENLFYLESHKPVQLATTITAMAIPAFLNFYTEIEVAMSYGTLILPAAIYFFWPKKALEIEDGGRRISLITTTEFIDLKKESIKKEELKRLDIRRMEDRYYGIFLDHSRGSWYLDRWATLDVATERMQEINSFLAASDLARANIKACR